MLLFWISILLICFWLVFGLNMFGRLIFMWKGLLLCVLVSMSRLLFVVVMLLVLVSRLVKCMLVVLMG